MAEYSIDDRIAEGPAPEVRYSDAEFLYHHPPEVPGGALPIFDEEIGNVVGFRWVDPTVDEELAEYAPYKIYDLEGRVIEEQTIFDPPLQPSYLIEDLILLFSGAGAALRILRGGGGLAVRVAGRQLARGAAYGVSAAVISRSALTGLRMAWRVMTTRQVFKFTETAARHMGEPGRQAPVQILQLAVRYGRKTPDPQGVSGLFMYTIPIRVVRNGRSSEKVLEVLMRDKDFTIFHFLYK